MLMSNEITNIIEIKNVRKSFKKGRRQELLVLDNINFSMKPGEIVAILGKSGSGKSTLLRIIAGLTKPTQGEVFYRGDRVSGPVHGISMVFQNFALMPWLTVLQNVELGLEAQGINIRERRKRALRAIDTIGLDGFESAFPKELSGGMRQRVGFARAIVVNPDILLMDEPFSALDVLTAENLRGDLVDLWNTKKTRLNGILLVTHSIEEAVQMADRILIFSNNPGSIHSELTVDLPHPRKETSEEFQAFVDQIYTLMTTPEPVVTLHGTPKAAGLGYRLPDAHVSEFAGLLETLNAPENKGRMDLPELSEHAHMDIDDLFPLTEALEILHFAKVSEGDITITQEGKKFAEADILERKKLFLQHLKTRVPLAKHIRNALDNAPKHTISEEVFLEELKEYFTEQEAERVLTVVIDWGRYAELFAYDYNTGNLSLENPA
ncbi:MAG: AAA-associated domain-containing protein [Gammaproteobacteria bacterium]